MTNEKQGTGQSGASGVVFVGCLILGIAVGLLFGNIVVGLLGGLGVGFIGLGVMRAVTGSW